MLSLVLSNSQDYYFSHYPRALFLSNKVEGNMFYLQAWEQVLVDECFDVSMPIASSVSGIIVSDRGRRSA